jgi:hypothetical protein
MEAKFHKDGFAVDYTNSSGSLQHGGDVVQVADGRVGVLINDLANGEVGVVQVKGIARVRKVTGAIVARELVGWDENGSPVSGTALSGAATVVEANEDLVMGFAVAAAASGATHVLVALNEGVATSPIECDNGTGGKSGAVLLGSGTEADRTEVTTADAKFLKFYLENKATSGDNRGLYLGFWLGGAGGGGEALRNRTVVNAACGTAHGGHSGLEFGTDGSVSGLAAGHRATLMGKNAAASATLCGGMSELWADGTSTNWATATEHSIHRFVNSGDGTGKATAQNVWAFAGLSTGSGKMFHDLSISNVNEIVKSLRIVVNGVAYYIPLKAA